MYDLPTSIEVNGQSYAIRNRGDYRMVLDCFELLEDIDLSKEERMYACLIVFFEGMEDVTDLLNLGDLNEVVTKVFDFFNCGQPKGVGRHVEYKVIDWKQDEQLIASAINKVANKEIRLESYIHWWTFMGYYLAIDDSPLSTIVGIRNKLVKGKKLEKHENEFRRNNPEYFVWNADTAKRRENDDLLKELWDFEGNIDG